MAAGRRGAAVLPPLAQPPSSWYGPCHHPPAVADDSVSHVPILIPLAQSVAFKFLHRGRSLHRRFSPTRPALPRRLRYQRRGSTEAEQQGPSGGSACSLPSDPTRNMLRHGPCPLRQRAGPPPGPDLAYSATVRVARDSDAPAHLQCASAHSPLPRARPEPLPLVTAPSRLTW